MFRAGFRARRSDAASILALALLGTLSACGGRLAPESTAASQETPDAEMPAQAGSVSAQVDLPAGVNVSMVRYTVSGPPGFQRSSMLSFPASPLVEFLITSLPPASHYVLDISMIGEVGSMTCTANGNFAVLAGLQTNMVLRALCT